MSELEGTYKSIYDAIKDNVSEGELVTIHNAETAKEIKNLDDYKDIVIMVKGRDSSGSYKSLIWFKKTPTGVVIVNDVYDEGGFMPDDHMWGLLGLEEMW